MNKINIILICVLIALISGVVGFIVGINVNSNPQGNKDLVGTYKTNTGNGKEAIIALQKDKSMICPNGSGTWLFEDGKLYIEYDYTDSAAMMVDEFNKNIGTNQESNKDYKKHAKQEVMVVESGLMYNGHFFEKVNK